MTWHYPFYGTPKISTYFWRHISLNFEASVRCRRWCKSPPLHVSSPGPSFPRASLLRLGPGGAARVPWCGSSWQLVMVDWMAWEDLITTGRLEFVKRVIICHSPGESGFDLKPLASRIVNMGQQKSFRLFEYLPLLWHTNHLWLLHGLFAPRIWNGASFIFLSRMSFLWFNPKFQCNYYRSILVGMFCEFSVCVK